MLGGAIIGKGISKYGSYGFTVENINATGLGRYQVGSINIRSGDTKLLTGAPKKALNIPQGLSRIQFEELSKVVRTKANDLGLGDDIFVQGSRAGGTAKTTSDIDLAIRVSPEKFDDFLFNQSKLSSVNPGTAKEKTLLHAIESGKFSPVKHVCLH